MQNDTSIKGKEYAQAAVALLASGTPKLDTRIRMAKAVASHGNYDKEGKAVWAEYLSKGCPRIKL